MELRILFVTSRVWGSSGRVLNAVLFCTLFLLNGCSRTAQETARPQAIETSKVKAQIQAPQPELQDCDPPPNKLDASRATGHHRVVLTWNPSRSSSGSNDQSVGYCLYRSHNDDIRARDLRDCRNCARLNRRPIIGTGCVDNHVEDGTTYYYIAGAVRVGTKVNLFSNKTTATIPANAHSQSFDSQYPLCQPDDSPPVPALAKSNR